MREPMLPVDIAFILMGVAALATIALLIALTLAAL